MRRLVLAHSGPISPRPSNAEDETDKPSAPSVHPSPHTDDLLTTTLHGIFFYNSPVVENQDCEEGGTSIAAAIEAATAYLLGVPGREDRAQILVLMTDGYENGGGDPAAAAAIAKAAGITFFVVAVDVGGTEAPPESYESGCWFSALLPSCIDEPLMLEVAGDITKLFVVNTFAGLADDVATGVIDKIEVPCATGATLTVGLDAEPVAEPTVSSGEVEVNGTTVSWTMDSVVDSAAMTFSVDYCGCDEYREATVEFLTDATYSDDEANDAGLSGLLDLTAQMTEPCPTPGEQLLFFRHFQGGTRENGLACKHTYCTCRYMYSSYAIRISLRR